MPSLISQPDAGPSSQVLQPLNARKRSNSGAIKADAKKLKTEAILIGVANIASSSATSRDKKKRRKRKRKTPIANPSRPESSGVVSSRVLSTTSTATTLSSDAGDDDDGEGYSGGRMDLGASKRITWSSRENSSNPPTSQDKGKARAESTPPTPNRNHETEHLTTRIVALKQQCAEQTETIQKHQDLIQSFQQSLTCQICLDLLHKPFALAPCGHITCYDCLVRWFTAPLSTPPRGENTNNNHIHRQKTCPVCRGVVVERPAEVWSVKSMVGTMVRSGLIIPPVPESTEQAATSANGLVVADPNVRQNDPWHDIFRPARHRPGSVHDYLDFLRFPIRREPPLARPDGENNQETGMYDAEDHVYRCMDCMHEIHRGRCTNCARTYGGHRNLEDGNSDDSDDDVEGLMMAEDWDDEDEDDDGVGQAERERIFQTMHQLRTGGLGNGRNEDPDQRIENEDNNDDEEGQNRRRRLNIPWIDFRRSLTPGWMRRENDQDAGAARNNNEGSVDEEGEGDTLDEEEDEEEVGMELENGEDEDDDYEDSFIDDGDDDDDNGNSNGGQGAEANAYNDLSMELDHARPQGGRLNRPRIGNQMGRGARNNQNINGQPSTVINLESEDNEAVDIAAEEVRRMEMRRARLARFGSLTDRNAASGSGTSAAMASANAGTGSPSSPTVATPAPTIATSRLGLPRSSFNVREQARLLGRSARTGTQPPTGRTVWDAFGSRSPPVPAHIPRRVVVLDDSSDEDRAPRPGPSRDQFIVDDDEDSDVQATSVIPRQGRHQGAGTSANANANATGNGRNRGAGTSAQGRGYTMPLFIDDDDEGDEDEEDEDGDEDEAPVTTPGFGTRTTFNPMSISEDEDEDEDDEGDDSDDLEDITTRVPLRMGLQIRHPQIQTRQTRSNQAQDRQTSPSASGPRTRSQQRSQQAQRANVGLRTARR